MRLEKGKPCRSILCGRTLSGVVLTLSLFVSGNAVVPQTPEEEGSDQSRDSQSTPTETTDDPEFARELARLKAEFPDLRSFVMHRRTFLRQLWKIAEKEDGESDPARLAKLQLIAASSLEAAGRAGDARKMWLAVMKSSAPSDIRGKAFFDIGMHYFLRQRYRDAWRKYWRHLPSIAPDSQWTRRTVRYAPFLRMVDDRVVPQFEGRFGELGLVRSADLSGRWVIVHFWSTTAQGSFASGERMNAIKAGLRGSEHPVTILGVNVDIDTTAYESALVDWGFDFDRRDGQGLRKVPLFDWPQHHDGLGFESPIVRALAIPRAPIEMLIGPDGKLLYVTERVFKKRQDLRKILRDSLAAER